MPLTPRDDDKRTVIPASIHRLSRDEMGQAALVYRAAFDERLPWLAGLHTPSEDCAFYRNQVFAQCEVWGAVDDGLIGFIAFRREWIDQFYVRPARQRQGVGVGEALLEVAQATFPGLHLWTFQRNAPARRFYEKRGFVALEETDGSRNEEREPDILYRWQRPAC